MNAAKDETSCSEAEHEKTGVEAQTASADYRVNVQPDTLHCFVSLSPAPVAHTQLTVA